MNVPTQNLKYYKKIIAISEAVKNDIEQRSTIRPLLVYNSVNIDLIDHKTDYKFKTYRIIQIGRLIHSIKGQHVLVEALKIVVHDMDTRNISVDFVGNGPSFEYLINLIKYYQLENYVNLLGSKDRVYLYKNLKNYNLLVQPSLIEGFGLTIVESMAAKVPTLVSDIDGPAEIVEKGRYGFLFRSGDAVDLANKILELIQINGSAEFTAKITAAHKHASKNFNIKEMVRELERIYLAI